MRQIDNMTPQEIEVLYLKGMLAEAQTADRYSPEEMRERYAKLWEKHIATKRHADALAEALRQLLAMNHGLDDTPEVKTAEATLAAYGSEVR